MAKKKIGCLGTIGIIVALFFIFFVIIMIIAVNSPKKTSTSASNVSTSVNTVVPTSTPEEKPIKITASKLADEYDSNKIAADKKYKGKLLEVTGVISDIGTDIMGTPYYALETDKGYIVQCMVPKANIDEMTEFKKGDGIVITRYCKGMLFSFIELDYKK